MKASRPIHKPSTVSSVNHKFRRIIAACLDSIEYADVENGQIDGPEGVLRKLFGLLRNRGRPDEEKSRIYLAIYQAYKKILDDEQARHFFNLSAEIKKNSDSAPAARPIPALLRPKPKLASVAPQSLEAQ